ncbi:MAG TPA: hypothetical protein VK615_11540 [Candidatus Binatia bacterium]|nr:hypothetical protein [Candidatus Binatia bacterium]
MMPRNSTTRLRDEAALGRAIELRNLPTELAEDVLKRFALMRTIHNATRKQTACKMLATGQAGRGKGKSWHRLRALYYQFCNTGDWRVLLDKSRVPSIDKALKQAFLVECGKPGTGSVTQAFESLRAQATNKALFPSPDSFRRACTAKERAEIRRLHRARLDEIAAVRRYRERILEGNR